MQTEKTHVVVTGIEIPLGDLVVTLIKVAVAMVPATLIVVIAGSLAFAVLTALLAFAGK